MINRQKVINGLKAHGYTDCTHCPYWGTGHIGLSECKQLAREAFALLKAQEAVEPTEPDEDNIRYCGACGAPVGYEVLEPPGMDYICYNYCQNCGQAVKWE